MKKFIYTLIAILFLHTSAFCQARYVFIEYKDAQKPAIQNEFSFADKTVSDAIEEKLSKMGYKGKDTKGYTIYRGVKLDELGNQPYDLYFKTERKSRKDKDNTVVSMLVSTGDESFVSDATDSMTISRAKTFLNNLLPAVEAYDLQLQVNAQQDAVTKAEKKYKNLQDDADDLQKKKKKLDEQIQDNLKEQKNQLSEIENQKKLFETIKAKQKN